MFSKRKYKRTKPIIYLTIFSTLVVVVVIAMSGGIRNCEDGMSRGYGIGSDRITCVSCPSGSYKSYERGGGFITAGNAEDNTDTDTDTEDNNEEIFTCTICPVGSYSDEINSSECLLCPEGMFNDSPGQAFCFDCLEGTFAGTIGSPVCEDCAGGTFTDSLESTVCEACSRGKFASRTKATRCEDCVPGTFNADIGAQRCRFCEFGTYSSESGAETCTSCARGTYADQRGFRECTSCPVGTASNSVGSTNLASCSSCLPGTFASNSGQTTCQSCGLGKFAGGLGNGLCQDCPIHTFSANPGQSECASCPIGRYANDEGMSTCGDSLICAPGTIRKDDSENLTSECEACPHDFISTTQDALTCEACALGFYTTTSSAFDCIQEIDCAEGDFVSIFDTERGVKRVACESCPSGTFSNATNSNSCFVCPPDHYENLNIFGKAIGCIAEDVCLPGQVANILTISEAGGPKRSCTDCPINNFSVEINAVTCSTCPSGSYTNLLGSISCIFEEVCIAGYYVSEVNEEFKRVACQRCPGNSISTQINSYVCQECPNNHFATPSLSPTECAPEISCGPGQFVTAFEPNNGVRRSCGDCPIDTFSVVSNTTECQQCPSNRYTMGTGSITCANEIDCPPGSSVNDFSPSGKRISCNVCSLDTFSTLVNSPLCTNCDSTSFTLSINSTECVPEVNCTTGQYVSLWEETRNFIRMQCSLCPVNTYTNVSNFYYGGCEPCPAETFTELEGSEICLSEVSCPTGTSVSSFGGVNFDLRTSCSACPENTISTVLNSNSCSTCPKGTFASPDSTVCITGCWKGTYVNLADPSGDGCTYCEKGTFSNTVNSPSCSICPVDTYADGSGREECWGCNQGYTTHGSAAVNHDHFFDCHCHSFTGEADPSLMLPKKYLNPFNDIRVIVEGIPSGVCGAEHWDVTQTTSLSGLFLNARDFNSDISQWDTSNIVDFSSLFENAQDFNKNLGLWNLTRASTTASMFLGAISFDNTFSNSIDNWNVENVLTFSQMFKGASSFNRRIGNWQTFSLTNIDHTFDGATSFNQVISEWLVDRVTSMEGTFKSAHAFNNGNNLNGLNTRWDVSSVENMKEMFFGAKVFRSELGTWDVSEVTTMNSMFRDTPLFNSNIASWDVQKVTDMNYMFAFAEVFNYDITGWEMSGTVQYLLYNARAYNQSPTFASMNADFRLNFCRLIDSVFVNRAFEDTQCFGSGCGCLS